MRLLVVGNDLDQLDTAAYVLRRERFVVIQASNGPDALRRLEAERPDLVVLDLGLPPPGSLELLRQIRIEHKLPVLIVAGPDERHESIRCFDLGADDFITRPYVFGELTVRIRAILRRAQGFPREQTEPRLEFGDLRLDPEAREVEWGSLVIRLTPTEFRIFYALVRNAGHVVPASRLFTYVWGNEGGAANSLRSHICHLRKKLGLDGAYRGSIASVPAVGYVFWPSMENVAAPFVAPVSEQVASG
jgi:DNA-binding response OmpR family regulator